MKIKPGMKQTEKLSDKGFNSAVTVMLSNTKVYLHTGNEKYI
jgi:hypothetical protein